MPAPPAHGGLLGQRQDGDRVRPSGVEPPDGRCADGEDTVHRGPRSQQVRARLCGDRQLSGEDFPGAGDTVHLREGELRQLHLRQRDGVPVGEPAKPGERHVLTGHLQEGLHGAPGADGDGEVPQPQPPLRLPLERG